jgi:hypothetical protein
MIVGCHTRRFVRPAGCSDQHGKREGE